MLGAVVTSAVQLSLVCTDMSSCSSRETGAGPANRHSSSAAQSLCSMEQQPSMWKTHLQQELCSKCGMLRSTARAPLSVGRTWSSMSANRPSSSTCCSCSLDNLSPNLFGRFLQAQRVIPADCFAMQILNRFLQEPQVQLLLHLIRALIAPAGASTLLLLGTAEPYIGRRGVGPTHMLHKQRLQLSAA